MLNHKHLNIANKLTELQYWLIDYLDAERPDEAELMQRLDRNLKSMQAINERARKGGGKI